MTPTDIVKWLREETERLAQTSPPVPPGILHTFHDAFLQEDVAKPPETNGLTRIHIVAPETPEAVPERVRITMV